MIRSAFAVAAASLAASFACSQPVFAQDETDQRFGTVHFDTSCNEVAQPLVNDHIKLRTLELLMLGG